jgi:hypothetical protein
MRFGASTAIFVLALLQFSSGCRTAPYGEEPEPKKPKKTTGASLPSRDAGPSGPALPVLDAGTGAFERPNDAGPDASAGPCPGPYQGPYLWKAPPAPSSACSTSDIGFFEGLITAKDANPQDVENALRRRNATCASCVFSVETDSTWGPYVFDAQKTFAIYNMGACYANAPGGSEACGHVAQQWFDCMWDVCRFCGTEAEMNECWLDARSDPNKCNRFDFETACNGNLLSIDAACGTISQVLTVTCGADGS